MTTPTTQPFHVKLPVFEFSGGVRGILVSARVGPTGMANAVLFCSDGTQKTILMQTSRIQKATQHGPFVVLIEQQGVSGTALENLTTGGLVGPDGMPIG